MRLSLPRNLVSHTVALLVGMCVSLIAIPLFGNSNSNIPISAPPVPNIDQLPEVSNQSTHTNFVSQAIESTGNAVVRIDTSQVVTQQVDPLMNDPFFNDFFNDRLTSPNEKRTITGQGSGFITSKEGIILTNAHVVENADQVTILLKDGRTFEGQVMGTDDITDLAVVKIDPAGQDLPVAALGDSSQVKVGDWAIAVGNPVGLNNTVTLGIISTLERSSFQVGIPDKRVEFLQTDAAINPGNSGGPLLDEQGRVIGINTAIRADATGIGFAIPINKAKKIQPILAAGKQVPHPYIGVQMIDLEPVLAQKNNQNPNAILTLPEIKAVLVVEVIPNTPADRGGIKRGDVIVEVNQQKSPVVKTYS
ncbi:MAG: trypsin-like serine protease [Synechococcaceae cyanobacterium RL_1_2]|nr:trypsin-like serine protease [Synechococcaceae cyanobacterium RL_1_2]